MKDEMSALTENVIYCHNNGLLEDDLGRAIMGIYKAGVCDSTIASLFAERVASHKINIALNGKPVFKAPRLSTGNYVFGFDEKKNELRSFIQYLNAHCLTIAGSGAGKTNLSYYKIMQVAPNTKGLWLFDLRKKEFAVLKSQLAKLGVDLVVLPGRSLEINPLELPKGVTLEDWIPRVADTLVNVLQLPPRASKSLQAVLFHLFQRFENKNIFPTLFDLFEEIKSNKDLNHQARVAILDSLEPVLLSLGPKVLAYRRGWSSDELAKRHICFELAGLSEVDKNLILNSLVLSEFTSRIARNISNKKMDLWMCIDEAQRLCSSSNTSSAIGDLIGLVRGSGLGLDLSLQSANDVLPAIKSNTSTKVMGRCGSMADYAAAGHAMGLTPEQIHWAQMTLCPGKFICQLGEGKWRYPFVFTVPLVKVDRNCTNQSNDLGDLQDLPTVYASEYERWGKGEVGIFSKDTASKKSQFDSPQEYAFCKAVVDNPMHPSSEYTKLAGIRAKNAKQIRESLIEKKYIREHTLDTGGRGRSTLLLDALPEGSKAVEDYDKENQ